MKIRDFFKFKALNLFGDQVQKFAENNPIPLTHPILDKNCLVGIEVEVENVPRYLDHLQPMWTRVEDNSLRNNGWEYISAPIKGPHIEFALRKLYADLKVLNPKYTFSGRTSIHVHMNARTMTCEQAAAMLLLYVVFEKTLFRFVGGDRARNHHCVPLRECNITEMMTRIIRGETDVKHWMKYASVNILPLAGKGTIEFRHMAGTDDVDKIMTWIHLLMKLKLFCYKRSYKTVVDMIVALNTKSTYMGFANMVFDDFCGKLDLREDDIAEGVSLVKLYEHSHTYTKSITDELNRLAFERNSAALADKIDKTKILMNGPAWITLGDIPPPVNATNGVNN